LEWTNRFVFKAPISGRLIYLTPIQENKVVQVGRSIGFIAPFNVTYFVEITLPQSNFGKSFVGQPVQLHFHAYPFVEFGYVSGRLSYISDIASDTGFLATVQLDNGLVTNRGNTLQYREGLKAEAKIITKDIRLLERFYRNTLIQMDR
jgi:HlyD family secretion protein